MDDILKGVLDVSLAQGVEKTERKEESKPKQQFMAEPEDEDQTPRKPDVFQLPEITIEELEKIFGDETNKNKSL